jgi:hypothetical protein
MNEGGRVTWIRIREISFPVEETDRVIMHVRDTTVARCAGEGYRGSRLLVDRAGGTALEVSYWLDEQGARVDGSGPAAAQASGAAGWPPGADPTGVPGGAVVRTRYYELAVDAG